MGAGQPLFRMNLGMVSWRERAWRAAFFASAFHSEFWNGSLVGKGAAQRL